MANRSSSSGARASGAPSRSAVRTHARPRGAAATARAAGTPPRDGADAPRVTPGSPRFESASARAAMVAGRLSALPRLAAARVRDVGEGVRDGVRERLARRTERAERAERTAGEERGGTDWRRVGVFGAGLAIGALLGAGTALLLAPSSGFETRVRLVRGARRAGTRVADRVEDWGDVVRHTAHAGRTTVERKLTRGRWAAEDAWERRRDLARARARAGMHG